MLANSSLWIKVAYCTPGTTRRDDDCTGRRLCDEEDRAGRATHDSRGSMQTQGPSATVCACCWDPNAELHAGR